MRKSSQRIENAIEDAESKRIGVEIVVIGEFVRNREMGRTKIISRSDFQ